MMNVISMMDNFDTNVISTGEKQYSIINGSDHSSCAELQRTLFYGRSSGMDDGLFGTACPQPHLIGRPFQR
jgi:hypothetical protein